MLHVLSLVALGLLAAPGPLPDAPAAETDAVALSWPADTTALARADAALEREAYDTAVRLYRLHLEAVPDSYDAAFGLARALSYSEQFPVAIARFSELVERDPNNADARVGRGYAYLHSGRTDAAIDDFRAALDAYPAYTDAWQGLTRAHLQAGRSGDAVDAAVLWIAVQPEEPAAYLARARAYLAAGRAEEARGDLRAAERLGAAPAAVAGVRRRLNVGAETRMVGQRFRLSTGYAFETFGGERVGWHTYTASLAYDAGPAVLVGAYHRHSRFDRWADALEVDQYVHLWNGAFAHVSGLVGLGDVLYPTVDASGELSQDVGAGWSPFVGYRYVAYSGGVRVHAARGGVVRYVARWYMRAEGGALRIERKYGATVSTTVRRYLGRTDTFVEGRVGYGYGHEIVDVTPDAVFEVGPSSFALLRVQFYPLAHTGVSVGATYDRSPALPVRAGVSLWLMRRW